jgi:hypothetical protein
VLVVPLPPNAELESLLGGLLMRAVKVAGAGAPAPPVALAHFRTDDPVLEVAVVCDLPLAASLSAALSVVPVQAVKDAIAAGALSDSLRENFGEVMNVVRRFLCASGRRFELAGAWCPPQVPPPALAAAAASSDERRELAVDVSGYVAGRMAFCTL